MDIQTKEQFFDRYDKLTKNLYQSDKINFPKNLTRWLYYLINSDIPQVKFVIRGLIEKRSFKEFKKNVAKYLVENDFDPFINEKSRAFLALRAVKKKSAFWNDFGILKSICNLEENRDLLPLSFTAKQYEPAIENVTAGLREIFVKCLEITDDDPIVDGDEQREIPASDRIVKINHNAPEYQKIIEKLEELEASISKSNSIENEDKDRFQAELKAGEGILKGKTARIEVIKTLLVKGLKYIIEHVADVVIVVTAEYLLKLIFQYFGLTV